MSHRLPHLLVVLAALLLAATLLSPLAPAGAATNDTIAIVEEGETPSNVEVAARLAEATFAGPVPRVLLGRADDFADNMASAVMQDQAPLLLVPSDGPIPERVLAILEDYAPGEIVLLGGVNAISAAVEDQLDDDYAVVRRAGQTRFETAIDIADKEAPTADTVILARGFGDPDSGDGSQAFADALAAGGWAAEMGWPILLTPTASLPGSVAEYLGGSDIETVMIMGGTAAVGQGVESELVTMGMAVNRIAGPSRFGTAIEIAGERGVEDAEDAGRVVLVEGQAANAWAGGFAAAGHSAANDAPIVLTNGDDLPEETEEFLTPDGGFAGLQPGFYDDAVLTCVAVPAACEKGRQARGLPPSATVTFTPPSGSSVPAGSIVEVQVESDLTPDHEVAATCADTVTGQAPGTLQVAIDASQSGPCEVTSTLTFANGTVQVDRASYDVTPPEGGILTTVHLDQYTYVPGDTEVLVEVGEDDAFTVDGTPATQAGFFEQATRGDLVSTTASFAQTGAPAQHDLVNRQPGDYDSGVLGNVDLLGGTAAIIEPVSGYELRPFSFDGALFTIDGANATRTTFEGDASEGDRVQLGEDGTGTPTIGLSNDSVAGPVTGLAVISSLTSFRIDSGGLGDAPLIGDDPANDEDNVFEAEDVDSQAFTIDGEDATYAEFESAINDGDVVRYSRTGGEERFALEDAAPTGTTGLATEDADFGSGDLTLLVEGQGRQPYVLDTVDGDFSVDGVVVTYAQFTDAYTAGDNVTVTPATQETNQRVALFNAFLTGRLANIDTIYRFYDVTTTDGTVYMGVPYNGNVFGTDDNAWFVDGTEVSLNDFETALDGVDTDIATIEVRPAGDDGVGLRTEHRLDTGT